MKYRKKPVVVDAWQWDGTDPRGKWPDWISITKPLWSIGNDQRGLLTAKIQIPTLEGIMSAYPNNWIIRGVKGEIYPCKPDIFEMTYEPVESV